MPWDVVLLDCYWVGTPRPPPGEITTWMDGVVGWGVLITGFPMSHVAKTMATIPNYIVVGFNRDQG